MNNTLVALMFGIGFAGWVYTMVYKRVGGSNMKVIWVSTVMAGLVGAFVIYTLFAWVFPSE